MSAVQLAQAAYGNARNFTADLHAHLCYGFVASTPHLFAMWRPVKKDADARFLSNIRWQFGPQEADCWLVWSASGSLDVLVKLLPYELPYVAFHRRHDLKLRIYPWKRLERLATRRRPTDVQRG